MGYDFLADPPATIEIKNLMTKLDLLVKEDDPIKSYLTLIGQPMSSPWVPDWLVPAESVLSSLPVGSWFIQFGFTLSKPWLSKDDVPFYVKDGVNPVRKDKAFRVPTMASSSWKGLLRDTARRIHHWTDEQTEMQRLFGNAKSADDAFRAGRLMFYPTFFGKIDVEMINPHNRKTKAGTKPIYFECVPVNEQGTFSILYMPFDLIGKSPSDVRQESLRDLMSTVKSVGALMLKYGFSAKRSSGFGIAQNLVRHGFISIHDEVIARKLDGPRSSTNSPHADLPKYLVAPNKLQQHLANSDGTLRIYTESEFGKMRKADRQEYEKAKKWWEREGKTLLESSATQESGASPQESAPIFSRREFTALDELTQYANELVSQLTEDLNVRH